MDQISTRGNPDWLLNGNEVANLFKVSPKTVYRWARSGKLPYILTPGNRYRYRLTDVYKLRRTEQRRA